MNWRRSHATLAGCAGRLHGQVIEVTAPDDAIPHARCMAQAVIPVSAPAVDEHPPQAVLAATPLAGPARPQNLRVCHPSDAATPPVLSKWAAEAR